MHVFDSSLRDLQFTDSLLHSEYYNYILSHIFETHTEDIQRFLQTLPLRSIYRMAKCQSQSQSTARKKKKKKRREEQRSLTPEPFLLAQTKPETQTSGQSIYFTVTN